MRRIGVDVGGAKIEAAALDAAGRVLARRRVPNPGTYDGAIGAIGAVRELVALVEGDAGGIGTLGFGVPGSIGPLDGLMRIANATYLDGRPLKQDLAAALGRSVRVANDANCKALSEAVDGATASARVVSGVILGTAATWSSTAACSRGATGIGGDGGTRPCHG